MANAVTLSQLGLRAFPPEIIEMIFTPLLTWTGKTSPLLAALRPDQQLYREALALFCKLNVFTLHRGNEWRTGDMKDTALCTIRTLVIEFWSSSDWEEWDDSQIIEPPTHSFSTQPILLAPHSDLRRIHMDVSSLSELNMKACLQPSVASALSLPCLREISVTLPRITYRRCGDEYDSSGLVEDLVRDFNGALGVRGKLGRVGAGGESGETMLWFWSADEEGGTLGACVRRARETYGASPQDLRGW